MAEVRFQNVAPVFPVADVERSLAWYGDVLGFEATYVNRDPEGEDPTNYAVLRRDGTWLHLVHWTSSHEAAPRFAERARAASAQFHLTGVEDLFAIVSGRGTVSILQPLQSRPWGAKDFTIEDPDGNRIVLSGADS